MLLLSQDEVLRCLPMAECVEVANEAPRTAGVGADGTIGGERLAGD